jgi:ribonuclease HI
MVYIGGYVMSLIHVFTDGACSGNPGPSGIGVYLIYNQHKKEISEYIGHATNNIAELMAIKKGLEAIKPEYREKPIVVYTDSAYCHGLFTKDWSPKKNVELIKEIRLLVNKFKYIGFKKVKGHSTDAGNNKADQLATSAIAKARK